MATCYFQGYCDRQNIANSKVCLAKEGSCDFQRQENEHKFDMKLLNLYKH